MKGVVAQQKLIGLRVRMVVLVDGYVHYVNHVKVNEMNNLTEQQILAVKQCIKLIVSDKSPMYPGVRTTFDLAQAQHVEQQLALLVAKYFGIEYDLHERYENVNFI